MSAVIFIQADTTKTSSSTESLPENVESQTRRATELLLNPTTMVPDPLLPEKQRERKKVKN